MKTLSIFILALCLTFVSQGQYQANYNKVWAFGYKAGLDFNSGSPVPITTGIVPPQFSEGCASVCDSFGNLLFYTNGSEVYNRNHVVMPGGTAIASFQTYSTTQSSVIVPVVDSPGKYYVFSLQQGTLSDTATCHLEYCKVDMALAGGYGDVVSSTKGTPVADSLAEKMIAVTGNNHNIWLLVHRLDTALFLAFEITNAGINPTPVVSATGTFSSRWGYGVGVIKASSNRRKIVSQTRNLNVSSFMQEFGTELYDFNPSTGVVSNCILLDSTYSHYGAEFSPDNTKLYSSQYVASDTMMVYQYNIGLTTPAAMRASKTLITEVRKINGCDMKLAPDRKIYFVSTDTVPSSGPQYLRYLDCITLPNQVGVSSGYVYRAVKLSSGTGTHLGLPSVYVTADTMYIPVEVTDVSKSFDFTIYPNPATNELFLSASEKITNVSICAVTGQHIFYSENNCELVKVDISNFPPNLYFVKVNGTITKEFLKQ